MNKKESIFSMPFYLMMLMVQDKCSLLYVLIISLKSKVHILTSIHFVFCFKKIFSEFIQYWMLIANLDEWSTIRSMYHVCLRK